MACFYLNRAHWVPDGYVHVHGTLCMHTVEMIYMFACHSSTVHEYDLLHKLSIADNYMYLHYSFSRGRGGGGGERKKKNNTQIWFLCKSKLHKQLWQHVNSDYMFWKNIAISIYYILSCYHG